MIVFAVLLPSRFAAGFHDGSVARCDGCHVTHQSRDGQPPTVIVSGELLRGASPSEVCLTCHANTLGRVMGGDPVAPPPELGAGNFVFLLEDSLNDGADALTRPIPGDAAGHNLVAPAWGLTADSQFAVSPGGAFPANQMGCTSCHNPHGGGTFRLLNGTGPVQGSLYSFTNAAPRGEGLPLRGAVESRTLHTAYQGGVSAWCGNCHDPRFHDRYATARFQDHPTDEILDVDRRDTYNRYNGTGDPAGGMATTAYLPEVPFEDLSATTTSTAGPGGGARIMCLTCHRAHASSAPSAGRWDFNVAVLGQDGIASGSYPIPNPYSDPAQAQLCRKCHPWDFGGP